jgi:hypothetical protein
MQTLEIVYNTKNYMENTEYNPLEQYGSQPLCRNIL